MLDESALHNIHNLLSRSIMRCGEIGQSVEEIEFATKGSPLIAELSSGITEDIGVIGDHLTAVYKLIEDEIRLIQRGESTSTDGSH